MILNNFCNNPYLPSEAWESMLLFSLCLLVLHSPNSTLPSEVTQYSGKWMGLGPTAL